jgi:(S)-mandelate dehydrogenase
MRAPGSIVNVRHALSISDLRRLARRRLPKVLFEVIESGVEDEWCTRRNEQAFQPFRFLPRYLVDVTVCDRKVSLLGCEFSSPFGIAPTGIAGVFRHDAELLLAQAAAEATIPFIASGASMASIEDAARLAPHSTWYQVYPARDHRITEDQVRRAADVGCAALVLTVDNPVLPKRERDMRNGAGLPFRPPFRLMLEALAHPAWLYEYFRHGGLPVMRSWAPYARPGASAQEVAGFFRSQSPTGITWRDLDRFRRIWPRALVVKGIMHPDDAVKCARAGVDAIILSNHGGKSLDRAPAPLEMLPSVRAATGKDFPVMLDSGIRRGSDIVVARCLGADFVFVGRATLYGVAAGGLEGARRAIDILAQEIDLTLALIGCPAFAEADARFLVGADDLRPQVGAFPGKVDTGFPKEMPPSMEAGPLSDSVVGKRSSREAAE